MPIGNICQSCGRLTTGLVACSFCGNPTCTNCLDKRTGVCQKCKGRIQS